jgi:hypothetical protein
VQGSREDRGTGGRRRCPQAHAEVAARLGLEEGDHPLGCVWGGAGSSREITWDNVSSHSRPAGDQVACPRATQPCTAGRGV